MNKIHALILLLLSIPMSANALSVETHEKFNENICLLQSGIGFSLDSFLMAELNFTRGASEKILFNGKLQPVSFWVKDGGRYEDKPEWTIPYVRSLNHFHDPLKPLSDAGYGVGDSAIVWAQKALGTQWVGGRYSWKDVRWYYKMALTAPSQDIREENFAKTFRGVGQLMHLTQDMSVPEHARNDGHMIPAYEEWLKNTYKGEDAIASALGNPKPFDINFLNQPSPFFDESAAVPIARLFDSEQYNGTNPQITMSPSIGLSEYTNANFLSGDTFSTQTVSSGYPYPSVTSITTVDLEIDDPSYLGNKILRPYYIKIADGEIGAGYKMTVTDAKTGTTVNGYRLAGEDYFAYYRDQDPISGLDDISYISPMDEYVFADYAKLLLPRAVGYSATLLHYFFRGQLETQANEKMDTNGNVIEVTINVTNDTKNETMQNGKFTLACRYKPANSTNYTYRVIEKEDIITLAYAAGKELIFTIDEGIPFDATDKQYTLVYHGTLGAEEGAVIGKVVEPINGEIAVTAPGRFVFAIADDAANKAFTTVRAKIANNKPDVELKDGQLIARAKYKRHLNHLDDLSTEPPNREDRALDYTYSSAKPVSVNFAVGTPQEITFNFSADPIPFGVTDLWLEISYEVDGSLKAFTAKDLNEPQYIGIWNSHDRFLIDLDANESDDVHNWQLLTEDQILNDPDLVARLDTDNGSLIDSIIDPVVVDADLYFAGAPFVSPGPWHISYRNVPAGRFGRVAILADTKSIYFAFHEKYVSSYLDSTLDGNYLNKDKTKGYVVLGVTNQEETTQAGTNYIATPIYTFRSVPNHFTCISVDMYPRPLNSIDEIVTIKEAEWPLPVNTAPFTATTVNP